MGLVWDTNMAAVSLFWDTNMAAVTSYENTIGLVAVFPKVRTSVNYTTSKSLGVANVRACEPEPLLSSRKNHCKPPSLIEPAFSGMDE